MTPRCNQRVKYVYLSHRVLQWQCCPLYRSIHYIHLFQTESEANRILLSTQFDQCTIELKISVKGDFVQNKFVLKTSNWHNFNPFQFGEQDRPITRNIYIHHDYLYQLSLQYAMIWFFNVSLFIILHINCVMQVNFQLFNKKLYLKNLKLQNVKS